MKVEESLTGTAHQNKEDLNKLLKDYEDVEDYKQDNGRSLAQQTGRWNWWICQTIRRSKDQCMRSFRENC
jgi:hypothetical protein